MVVSGEISTTTYVDIQDVARRRSAVGYTDADLGFSADSCAVINAIDKQSPDIAQESTTHWSRAPTRPTTTSWTSRAPVTRE